MNVVHNKGQKGFKRQKEMKKRPVRIVQISNPTKVIATTSEFKWLVQELTGQDSDVSLLRKYAAAEEEESDAPSDAAGGTARAASDYTEDRCLTDCSNLENNFEQLDEILPSEMPVNHANFLPFSSSLYGDYAESLQAAGW